MKALFLVFYGFQEYNGISKKIRYQINALKKCGFDIQTCHYEVTPNGNREWLIDGKELVNLGRGITAKFEKALFFFHPIPPITLKEREHFVLYIYVPNHNANPFTIHFVKELKKLKAAVFLEIPTILTIRNISPLLINYNSAPTVFSAGSFANTLMQSSLSPIIQKSSGNVLYAFLMA